MAKQSLIFLFRHNKLTNLIGSLDSSLNNSIGGKQSLDLTSFRARMMSTLTGDDFEVGPNHLKLLERNPKRLKRIKFLGQLFKNNGFGLKIAGGAVRDLVNNIEPVDIDFATDALPDDTLRVVKMHEDLLRVIVTQSGLKHGTVAVKFKEVEDTDYRKRLKLDTSSGENATSPREPVYDDESPFEITTLRYDRLTDGRHAEVEFINDWKKDAERRDLTINSMFLNLDDGNLIDYFGGEQDCKNRVIRFVGDPVQRIQEDYLRILRFFRFWSRISQQPPAADQLAAIVDNLDGLNKISGERIWQELKKIFVSPQVSRVYRLFLDINLFKHIGLEIVDETKGIDYSKTILSEIEDIEKNIKSFTDSLNDSQSRQKSLEAKQVKDLIPLIVYSVCLRTEESCLSTLKRLKYSNQERDTLLSIIASRGEDISLSSIKSQLALTPDSKRPNALQRFTALLILKGKFDLLQHLRDWDIPRFPLSGTDVSDAIRIRKLHPSKTKVILEAVKIKWIESNYQSDVEKLKAMVEDLADDLVTKSRD